MLCKKLHPAASGCKDAQVTVDIGTQLPAWTFADVTGVAHVREGTA